MRKRAHAFTLVELLVVVAILALLIAILLPAISKVQKQSLLVNCGANMHSMLNAIIQYSTENKGKLLPVSGRYGMATNGGTPGVGPLFNRSHFQLDNGGLGGMMTTAAFVKIRNCPGASDTSLPSYSYNVHPAVAGPVFGGAIPSDWLNVVPRWTSFTSHPKDRILMMDVVRDVASSSHASGTVGVWNLAFTDGSIRPVASKDLLAQLKIKPITGGTGAATTTSWERFNDYVRVLELINDGRDPKLAANGTKYYWDNPINGTNQPNKYYFPHWPGEALEASER